MKSFSTIAKEALFVGAILILLVYIVTYCMKYFNYPMGKGKDWNSHYFMEVSLLISGAAFHIICEYTGLNKWYVDNYYK
jgi:hypothetical protein